MEHIKISKKRVDTEHDTILEKRKAAADRLNGLQEQLKETQNSIGPKQKAVAEMESTLAALRFDSNLWSYRVDEQKICGLIPENRAGYYQKRAKH